MEPRPVLQPDPLVYKTRWSNVHAAKGFQVAEELALGLIPRGLQLPLTVTTSHSWALPESGGPYGLCSRGHPVDNRALYWTELTDHKFIAGKETAG